MAARPSAVVAADFDRDGFADIAVACAEAGVVSVLRGLGGGAFDPRVDYAAGSQPVGLAAGDLTGDGRPDLVVASRGSSEVTVLLHLAGGAFARGAGVDTEYGSEAVALTDVDHDQKLDLVIARRFSMTLAVRPGQGDGTFGDAFEFGGRHPVRAVAAGDLTGDGTPDLVAAFEGAAAGYVLLNTGPTLVGTPAARPVAQALSMRVWPTPAHGAMGIAWSLPSRAEARVLAFDAAGRAVREVARGEHGPGEHVVRWDGTSTAGERVVPGVYFIQVRASGTRVTRRVVLLD